MSKFRFFIFTLFLTASTLGLPAYAAGHDKKHDKKASHDNKHAPVPITNAEQIEAVIETYLMDNPQFVIKILNNASAFANAEEIRKTEQMVMSNADQLYSDARDAFIGRPDAPIRIVEFLDYNCGYCKRVFPTIMQLIANNDDIRIIFKEYPILGPASIQAARATLAAKTHGKYMTLHRALFESKASLNSARIDKIITQNGLDAKTINKEGNKAAIEKHIKDTLALGTAVGISGTPAFIINGKLYPGALSYEELQNIVDEARKAHQMNGANKTNRAKKAKPS